MTGASGTGWTDGELHRVGSAEELHVTSRRSDGTLRRFVTIWGVRVDNDIYVRSAHGADNPWFRRAVAAGVGVLRAGGADRSVAFSLLDPQQTEVHEQIDAAYHAKYDRYGAQIVNTVVGAHATTVTLRVLAQD